MAGPAVLVTGATGYLGRQVVRALAAGAGGASRVVGLDVREPPPGGRAEGVDFVRDDVGSPRLAQLMRDHAIEVVVHLAAIVTPGKRSDREREYAVDVLGTRNVVDACIASGVRRIVVSSSGAAYGYHADNPAWITEDRPLRGNPEFPYAHHKRLVEEMLASARREHPALEQVIFRIGTILGETTHNQITDLFEKPRLIAVRGSDSPFVFVWDEDVVGAIVRAVGEGPPGIYNLAGDGALTVSEIARRLDKPCVALPAWLLQAALWCLKRLGLTQYGPEQLRFLRFRPVLDNRRLKEAFGYVPRLTSEQAFDVWRRAHSGRA